MKKISQKHKYFCNYILSGLGKQESAIKAGYSPKTASVQATQIEKRPEVQEYLNQRRKELSMRHEITADRVLEEWARIAFSNIKSIMTVDEFDQLTPDQLACIKGIEKAGDVVRVVLHSKEKALEALSKHLKLYSDGSDVNLTITQMGDVKLQHTNSDGKTETLTFDIGQEPDKPMKAITHNEQ